MARQDGELIVDSIMPLCEEFGLEPKSTVADRHATSVLFTNETTGLKITTDWSELRLFVWLLQLKPTARSEADTANESLAKFDADDLIVLRGCATSPVGKMFGGPDDPFIATLLTQYADCLRKCAADVLAGDFSVFRVLSEIVAERARSLRNT